MRQRIRWIILGCAALLVAGVAWMAPRTLRKSSFFRLRQIEVVGTHNLEETDVVRRLKLSPHASTLDPLAPIAATVSRLPGVVSASVERRLPGTLRITLVEAAPVALATVGDRLVAIDRRGNALPFNPSRLPASLPIAHADSLCAGLLERVMLTDPDWYGSIESAHLERGAVVLNAGGRRFLVRADASPELLRTVVQVVAYLRDRGTEWREIDARYSSRVFVRKAAA